MMEAPGRAVCWFIACFVAAASALGQVRAADAAIDGLRLVAQMTPSGKLLAQEELVDRAYQADSLREAQAAERARHQDAMEQIQAFQKRARERYNDDMKWCRDLSGNECMRAAAARHRQANGESQRLHRREMDLYNHTLAVINRIWAPQSRRRTNEQSPLNNELMDAQSRIDAHHWARTEARAAEAERRALYERDQRETQRRLEQQRAFERAQRQAQQP
jgi:hypothetical protein